MRGNTRARPAQAKVVAIIPSFNTASTIHEVVSKAKKYVNQVIVVNDSSHDSTVEEARVSGVLVTSHDVNKGYGETIKSCFETAKAEGTDVLVILDGDGQHNPDEIPKLVAPILNQEADLVIGSRFLQLEESVATSPQTTMPRYRVFGIKIITFLWNFGSKTKVSDAQSGFRAYRKNAFQYLHLSERGMSVSIETLEKARRKGAVIREVPISCLYAPSTLNLKAINHGLSVALSVIRLRLKNKLFGKIRENERA